MTCRRSPAGDGGRRPLPRVSVRRRPTTSDPLEAKMNVFAVRHGETAWSLSGQHTGSTDIPLTEHGERNALRIRERLAGLSFAMVLTSPLQRAIQTCHLAGFGSAARADSNLVEWNYGNYEGLRTAEIRAERPDWQIFRD